MLMKPKHLNPIICDVAVRWEKKEGIPPCFVSINLLIYPEKVPCKEVSLPNHIND